MFFSSEQSLAELDETLATHKSETDQEADECAERFRHYRHGVDTICIVDLQQAQRERLRFHETVTKSVVWYKPIF